MDSVNPVLLLIFLAQICFGICSARSPQFLRWVSAYLLTRADVIDVSKRESDRRKKFWFSELKLNRDIPVTENREHASAFRRLSRP
jgi:hypothetical protein